MLRTSILVLLFIVIANVSLAQTGGVIGIFEDTDGNSCNLTEWCQTPGNLVSYYVVHTLAEGVSGSQFQVSSITTG